MLAPLLRSAEGIHSGVFMMGGRPDGTSNQAASDYRKARRPKERGSASEFHVRIYFFKADLLDFGGAGKQSLQQIILFLFVEGPGKVGT